jgi:membrane protein implicated in regulation of membrane protease activity
MMEKAQIIRITLWLVLASMLLIVNLGAPRSEYLWAPLARILVGAVILVPAARYLKLWR